jgi:hypothetical protein
MASDGGYIEVKQIKDRNNDRYHMGNKIGLEWSLTSKKYDARSYTQSFKAKGVRLTEKNQQEQ